MNILIGIIEYVIFFSILGIIIYKIISTTIEDIKEYKKAKEVIENEVSDFKNEIDKASQEESAKK